MQLCLLGAQLCVCCLQTIAAVSPNAAKLVTIGTPAYVQNAPFTVGASTTGIGVSEQLFNVAPCLITFAEQGINVNPVLIQVSPRLIQIDAIGIQVQPELITVDPTLINVGPNGAHFRLQMSGRCLRSSSVVHPFLVLNAQSQP